MHSLLSHHCQKRTLPFRSYHLKSEIWPSPLFSLYCRSSKRIAVMEIHQGKRSEKFQNPMTSTPRDAGRGNYHIPSLQIDGKPHSDPDTRGQYRNTTSTRGIRGSTGQNRSGMKAYLHIQRDNEEGKLSCVTLWQFCHQCKIHDCFCLSRACTVICI